ncbi:MAG: hypothetical protein VXW91_00100 [Pseudomonadota bacterium]|nr:hypothetical protein [Pseudomonadota bacterium]MEC8664468.1 hypothetical protein [Pseudomonadota bacterium]
MKVYIVCEHCDSWGGTPNEMADVILGVSLSKEEAEECLWSHASYGYSQGIPKLTLVDRKACDEDGCVYFEIIERDASQCNTPSY